MFVNKYYIKCLTFEIFERYKFQIKKILKRRSKSQLLLFYYYRYI